MSPASARASERVAIIAKSLRERGLERAAKHEAIAIERALLPRPLLNDPYMSVMVGYLPSRAGLVGGDFYDTIERADGTVLSIIGDVAGSGPSEAALGASLRAAWRTLVLAGLPTAELLPLLERVLEAERPTPELFVTICQIEISADRHAVDIYLAGHLPPLLVAGPVGEITVEIIEPTKRGRALGVPVLGGWEAQRIDIDGPFSIVMHTDGLAEAEVSPADAARLNPSGAVRGRRGTARLEVAGLCQLFRDEVSGDYRGLVDRVLWRVHQLHGGPLADDAAILQVGWTGNDAIIGERLATHGDSLHWVAQ